MTAERGAGGGGVSHPSQLTTGLVIKSVTTSPTLAGERMLFILQVSILSEQLGIYVATTWKNLCPQQSLSHDVHVQKRFQYVCAYGT